jgi:hypothetical protein
MAAPNYPIPECPSPRIFSLEGNKTIALADARTVNNDRDHSIGTLRQSVSARLATPSVCGMIQPSGPSADLARRL